MKERESNSGAAAIPYRIVKHYLGKIEDTITQDDLEAVTKFAGGDFALELKGEKLHLFRVVTREVRT